jgi:hypothetical protein
MGVVVIGVPAAVKTASNAPVLVGIPLSDQELQAVSPLAEIHERVPGLLGRPGGGWARGDVGQVDTGLRWCSMTNST